MDKGIQAGGASRDHGVLHTSCATMGGVQTGKIALLASDGVDSLALNTILHALSDAGTKGMVIAPRPGFVSGTDGMKIKVDSSIPAASSMLFDAVYIPGGDSSIATLKQNTAAMQFVNESYIQCKPIAASGAGVDLLAVSYAGNCSMTKSCTGKNGVNTCDGVVYGREARVDDVAAAFVEAVAQHRFWGRDICQPVRIPDNSLNRKEKNDEKNSLG